MNESLYIHVYIISYRLDQRQQFVDVCKQQQIASRYKVLLVLMVVLMTTRFDIHVSPTITSDIKTLQVCKQQSLRQ